MAEFNATRFPLISLVLATKNAMPHLKASIDALRRQSYRKFELLVQDGGSKDGTLEYLSSILDLPLIEVISEPDAGIGQAYNRGLRRCRGDLVCLVSSDEYLDDDALERGVSCFQKHPEAAILYGGERLVGANDKVVQVFSPPAFELLGLLRNEIVPPVAAAFLNRGKIGEDLYYDESLKTCPDYDFWLRVGSRFTPKEIIVVNEIFLTARVDRTSMTYRAESFEQFCRDKLFSLNRFLDSQGRGPLIEGLRRTAGAGIFTWAAESVFGLEGTSDLFLKLCTEAAKLNPSSARLLKLIETIRGIEIDFESGQVTLKSDIQPYNPIWPTTPVGGLIDIAASNSAPYWIGAKTERNVSGIQVTTGPAAWSYAAQIPLTLPQPLDGNFWYWVKLHVKVLQGQVGIGLLAGQDLLNEALIPAGIDSVDVFVMLDTSKATAVMIRNGSISVSSVVDLICASVECCPKQSHREVSIKRT